MICMNNGLFKSDSEQLPKETVKTNMIKVAHARVRILVQKSKCKKAPFKLVIKTEKTEAVRHSFL